jgi:hypothetical protein
VARVRQYPPDTRCEKCGHRYDEHNYRHPFVTSVQPVDTWARIAELEAEVERLRKALKTALFIIESAECSKDGCGSPWHSSGGGDFSGLCEGEARVDSFVDQARKLLPKEEA